MKLLLAVLVAFAFGGPAVAQQSCGIYASIIASLNLKYGETRRGFGLAGPVSAFELWASAEPPFTWTILTVYPSGTACMTASGENWTVDPPVPPGDPA